MSEMRLAPDGLQQAAATLAEASRDSQDIIRRVEAAMAGLEGKWAGATQQAFHQNYRDWREYMAGTAALLKIIATELDATADRFQTLDR